MKKLLLVMLILAVSVYMSAAGKGTGTHKNYMLVFDVKEYTPQLKDTLDFFLTKVFQKGDQLIVFSPVKLYGFSPKKLAGSKKVLAKSILKTLKDDIAKGCTKYRSTYDEMERMAREISTSQNVTSGQLQAYSENRNILNQLSGNIEAGIMKYAQIFRSVKSGENHLVIIFQKQYRPIPNRKMMDVLRSNPNLGFKASEAFQIERNKEEPDFKKVEQHLKYAKVKLHFLYLKERAPKGSRDVQYIENSGDFYSAFSKLCEATNGLKLATSKPVKFLEQVEQMVEGKVETQVVSEEQE